MIVKQNIKKLGELCHFVRGPFGGSLKKNCFKDEGYAVYEQQHAIYDQFNEIRYFIDENKFQEMKRFELKAGDLIMSCSGTMGKVAIVPEGVKQGIINQALLKLTPKENLNVEFLRYWMNSPSFIEELGRHTVGAAIKNVASVKILKTIELFVPPLQEQQQIVAILDEAFTAIDQAKANIEKNIENAKELFQSKLNAVFSQRGEGWEEKTLGEVAKYDKSKYVENNRPYVGLENIESNTGIYLGSLDGASVKSSTFKFDERHVLYGRLRPYLNKVLLPDFNGHCSTEIFPILPSKALNRNFLFYWLLSSDTVSKIDATWTGARMPRANMNEVINFSLPIPSVEEQILLSENFQKIQNHTESLITKYLKKLNSIEELKKSILQKAFAGELTNKEVEV